MKPTKPYIKNINHVAIAVPDLALAIKKFSEAFANKISSIMTLEKHGVRTVWIDCDNCQIELMEPYGKESPLNSFLKKNPFGGIHHICNDVANINNAVEYLTGIPISCSSITEGGHEKPVSFMKPKDFLGTLMELQEVKK